MPALVAATAIHIDRIANDAQLDALRDDWNGLAGDVPFRRFEWLATWWQHYRQPREELFVITARDTGGNLVGVAPWYLSRGPRDGRFLRFLGSGEVCTDYLTILTADGLQAEVATQIADFLATDGRPEWDRLELVGLDAGDPAAEALAARLAAHGYGVHWRAGLNCWRLEFPANWENYLMSLSKSRRERVRQFVRRGFETGRVMCGMVERPEELEFYFRRLVELHQKRRMSLGQRGSFTSPSYTAFHRDVMRQFFDLGLLRLWWTNIEGRAAAIEYDLIGGDSVYFYQSGLEPALADERPGWLEKIGSLRDAIDSGYRYFDFLRGDEAYKASWGATIRPAAELRIVAPRATAQARHTAWSTGQRLRNVAKSGWQFAHGRWDAIQRHAKGATNPTRQSTVQKPNAGDF